MLIGAASAALIAANSPLAPAYFAALHAKIGPLSVQHWVNDALMALFFFVVGLELKREWRDGHLSDPADRVLPGIAALAGMVLPALIFLLLAGSDPALRRGWAIPAATDIAFALAILALAGRGVPASLKLFLTTVAIVDDMGAVAIIALAYTAKLNFVAVAVAALGLAAMLSMARRCVTAVWPYALGALFVWAAMLVSGVHATVAGVLAALTVPIRRSPGAPDFHDSTLHRLETVLSPWSAFVIVPLFGFANAGLSFAGMGIGSLTAPLPLAIILGLVIGKQAGVYLAIRAAVALGWARRPARSSWRQVHGIAVLCGVGFTMSLFIGGLAFTDATLGDEVKLGVLAGSAVSALLGYAILSTAPRPGPRATG